MPKLHLPATIAVILALSTAPALAHLVIFPESAAAGARVEAVITVPHGCDDLPTTGVEMRIPDGFANAESLPLDGWIGNLVDGAIVWTGHAAAEDFVDFPFAGTVTAAPGAALVFLTTQTCDTVSIAWEQLAEDGVDPHSLDHPAPVLLVDGPMHPGPVTLGDLTISGAFSRATLPNAPVGGGFFTIANAGAGDDRLIAASSPVAGITQIHEMAMAGDVMRMHELPDGLIIPAGETVTLAPGGLHIMFTDLNAALVEGTSVPLTLTFEIAGTVEIGLAVAGISADTPEGHH